MSADQSNFWQSNWGIRLWIIAVAASWGTAFAFIKIITESGFGPFSTAAGRSTLTVVMLAIYLVITGHRLSRDLRSVQHMVVLGVFNGMLPNILIALAMQDLNTATAGAIQASVPIVVALGAHFFLRNERLNLMQIFGILVGLGGVFFVIGPIQILSGHKSWLGSLSMAGAAICYAASTLYLRANKPKDTLSVTLGSQIVSAIGAGLLALLFERTGGWHINTAVVFSFLGLAFVSTLIPLLLYFNLVKKVEASRAALVQYLLPLFTALYGIFLLNEPFAINVILGGAAILVGMAIATHRK